MAARGRAGAGRVAVGASIAWGPRGRAMRLRARWAR